MPGAVDPGAVTGDEVSSGDTALAVGAVSGLSSANGAELTAPASGPDLPGWHYYNTSIRLDEKLTPTQMASRLQRYAVPGQNPMKEIKNGTISNIYDPSTGVYVGQVVTTVSNDGLTVQNTTLPGHLLADGQVVRSATQLPDGSWSITTEGYGNNTIPGMNYVNNMLGPGIFRDLDERMVADELPSSGGGGW